MTSLRKVKYRPSASGRRVYDPLYRLYRRVHDAFGGLDRSADLSGVMKELLEIKEKQSR
jgi:L-ribulokinase